MRLFSDILVQGQFIRTDMQVHRLGTYVFEATLSGLTAGVTGPHIFVAGNPESDIIITRPLRLT